MSPWGDAQVRRLPNAIMDFIESVINRQNNTKTASRSFLYNPTLDE
jgi:hypothetical protein